jgi:hypothetical protein
LAFFLSLGFQLKHKSTCTGGGGLTRHSHYARVRLGGLTIWRIQCTSCKAVFTVLPHFVLRYRRMSPDGARQALMATHGGLSLEWCATQIPPDLVAKLKPLILLGLFYNYSDDPTWFKRRIESGNHGVSCLHHRRPIGPPLNPMECGFLKPIGATARIALPPWRPCGVLSRSRESFPRSSRRSR